MRLNAKVQAYAASSERPCLLKRLADPFWPGQRPGLPLWTIENAEAVARNLAGRQLGENNRNGDGPESALRRCRLRLLKTHLAYPELKAAVADNERTIAAIDEVTGHESFGSPLGA